MNPESGVQAAPAAKPIRRKRWKWVVNVVVLAALCWATRIVWLRRAEATAELALNEQHFYAARDELLHFRIVEWLVAHEIPTPKGHVRRVSNGGAATESDISDLSMLSAFSRLEDLVILPHVDGIPLAKSAQASLARTPPFPRLREFRVLRPTSLGDDFFQRFLQCPDLRYFAIDDPNFTDGALRGLASCLKLESLWIAKTRVHRGLNSLSLKSLRILDARDTLVDSAGLEGLRGCTQLEHLNLTRTAVDDAGLEFLADLSKLNVLGLVRTRVTRAGLERLLKLPELELLVLTETAVTVEDAIEFSKGHEGLTIFVGPHAERIGIENGEIRKSDKPPTKSGAMP